MTNFEKAEYRFGYDIKTNKVTKCDLMYCHDCKFINKYVCRHKQIKWLYKEYMALTDAEINLINTLEEMTGVTYEFIVRDAYDEINLFSKIPIAKYNGQDKYYLSQSNCISILDKTKKLFPNIQCKDGIYDITEEYFLEE